jgi:glycosyltransferase involved in cell wall biosynthesis
MAEQPVTPTFCLTIPSGGWDLAPLVAAIHEHHPESPIVAVWCGDPHLRPVLQTPWNVHWADLALGEHRDRPWNGWLVALEPRAYEMLRTGVAVRRLLRDGASTVIQLRVGSVAVLGPLAGLAGGAPMTMVRRAPVDAVPDAYGPSAADLHREGEWSTVAMSFGADADDALAWLTEEAIDVQGSPGPWLGRAATLFGAVPCEDPRVGIGAWSALPELEPVLLDLEHLDRSEPWHLLVGERPARVRLSASSVLAAAVERGLPQIAGEPACPRLPGGVEVDDAIRAALRDVMLAAGAHGESPVPTPFTADGSAFLAWLEAADRGGPPVGRYWSALVSTRADLSATFPRFKTSQATALSSWAATSWRLENRSVLIRPDAPSTASIRSEGMEPSGVNVLGYLAFDQGLGAVARQVVASLRAAGVAVAALNHERAVESERINEAIGEAVARYATNLVVVNADQFEFVVADHGATLLEGRRTIAYWFWELEDVPARFRDAIDHVDEIWTGSQFIADSFARVTDKPVQCVPMPVSEPQPSSRDRASMGLPADAYVFLTTFDQFSVPERKNPFGTIEAFKRAFADGEGPVLLIKTMNGAKGWRNHERLLLAASGRSDIIVWDEHLSRPDQMAVVAAADCLVSLHRSEGLGLHCAEAMWLAKPVIATAYSGNLDFMDGSVAAMIDHTMVNVRHGEGIYPETAMWADPDLDQAADWMRRLVGDPGLGRELGAHARQRMKQQPSLAETGRLMARLAGLQGADTDSSTQHRSGGTTSWD